MRTADTLIKILNGVLLGKERQIRLAVCCLISGGHLLIEDLPGMGKTTLATGLSSLLGLSFQRVQFTSDMLPADLIGMSVMNRESGKFEFRKGAGLHPGPPCRRDQPREPKDAERAP